MKSEWKFPLALSYEMRWSVYRPVAANQEPVLLVTKMIGAMQGCGRTTSVTIVAFPPPADAGPVVAGNASVRIFSKLPSLRTQLTIARKTALGFEPAFAPAARTNPWTVISRWPLALSWPEASPIVQAIPPPLIPRSGIWLCAPVRPAGTPTIASNFMSFGPLAIAVDTDPANKALTNRSADRVTRKTFFISISLGWFDNDKRFMYWYAIFKVLDF